MIRLSKILLFFTATVLLAWILPWACDFLIGAKPRTPFTLYSTVSGEFVSLQSGDRGRGWHRPKPSCSAARRAK